MFASSGNAYELWAAVLIIPIALSSLLRYAVYRYRLDADELVVRDGILTRTERHIPYARIQNIDLVQNPLHRLLQVALVRVETASGTKPEAVMRVLSLDAVEAMRERVFADASADLDGATNGRPASEDVLLELPTSELVRLGIISNKGLLVVGATLGLFWQRGEWFGRGQSPFFREYLDGPSSWFMGIANESVTNLVLATLLVGTLAILLLRLFSIAWFWVQLHGFTLRRQGDDLGAEYGLLTKISRTIPPSRIQTLIVSESPLHRLFGKQSVELRTVGGGGQDMGAGSGLEGTTPKAHIQWLAPLIDRDRLPTLLRDVLPAIDLTGLEWHGVATRAWRRILRRRMLVASLLVLPASVALGSPAFLAILPITLLAYVHARLWVRHAAYALTPWGIVFKSGWLNRTVRMVPYEKIQTVVTAESPFDRRSGMASVRIDTAGGERGGYTIDIPFLDQDIAANVAGHLSQRSQSTAFRW